MKQLFSIEKKALVFIFLLLLFIGDTIYSYYQHSLAPIDGDLPSLVIPSDAYKQVLQDPFGFKILQTGENCAASNRFFVQWTTYTYFRHVPLWLQSLLSPIDSAYASMAIAKTVMQVGLIFILASYVCITFGWRRNDWMLTVVIICPLFQAVGFFEYLCMIDNCSSYAFAYALSTLALMIFLFPYYRAAITGHSGLPLWLYPVWLTLPIILSFSSPLTGPVLLVLCPSTLAYLFLNNWFIYSTLKFKDRLLLSILSIDKKLLFSFGFTTLLCIYSFYIGTHNSENSWEVVSITERYQRLFEGLIQLLSFSEGIMPIACIVLLNLFILQLSKTVDLEKLSKLFSLLLLFTVAYLLLLPLGGYRSYRPFIIRRDTLQPVLWLLFFSWGLSTVYIIKYFKFSQRIVYTLGVSLVCISYTWSDQLPAYTNACEKRSLREIAASTYDCVELKESCTVMQWTNSPTCEDSRYCAELLYLWNITPRVIQYKHNP